jgi:hypothetical protein
VRLLSISYPLPNPEVDNHSIFNAPPWFDYPAVVVDPSGISRTIDEAVAGGDFRTAAGLPVRDAITSTDEVAIADVLRRRREEAIRLLERGGVLIVFAYPNALHPRVTGFTGCDRYFWLPAPPGLAYREPFLNGADGGSVAATRETHPASSILLTFEKSIAYRGYFDEHASGFRETGKVLARSQGGAATACELRLLGGTVIFLPAIEKLAAGQTKFTLAAGLLNLAKRLVPGAPGDAEPPWVEAHMLPGIESARRELEAAGAAAEAAIAERDAVSAELEELSRYRTLLWSEGYQLEDAVRRALKLFGFQVSGEPGRPAEAFADGVPAVVEVEGSKGDVSEDGFRRLSRKIEDDLLTTGTGKKGILVVNGHRLEDAADRPKGYDERLVVAAEFQGFALIPGVHLFRLVQLALTGRVDQAVIREAIVTTEGVFTPQDVEAPAGAAEGG